MHVPPNPLHDYTCTLSLKLPQFCCFRKDPRCSPYLLKVINPSFSCCLAWLYLLAQHPPRGEPSFRVTNSLSLIPALFSGTHLTSSPHCFPRQGAPQDSQPGPSRGRPLLSVPPPSAHLLLVFCFHPALFSPLLFLIHSGTVSQHQLWLDDSKQDRRARKTDPFFMKNVDTVSSWILWALISI